MTRLLIIATALTFVATTFAEAAPRKRGAAVTTKQVSLATFPNRPAWATAEDCYTDDGYGRFWPCSAGCRN